MDGAGAVAVEVCVFFPLFFCFDRNLIEGGGNEKRENNQI